MKSIDDLQMKRWLDVSPTGIVIFRDWQVIYANPRASEITGISREKLLTYEGSSVLDLVHPDDRNQLQARWSEEIVGKRSSSQGVIRIIRTDGALRWIETFAAAIDDETGRLIQVSFVDVTERKKAQEALEEYKKAFSAGPLLMAISRVHDGQYLAVNDTFCRVTGYDREDVVGRTSVEIGFISAEGRERLHQEMISKGRVQNMQLQLTRADGHPMICRYYGDYIMVNGEKRLYSLAEDITEQVNTTQALEESRIRETEAADATGIGFYFWDLQTNKVNYSESYKRQLGYSGDEFRDDLEAFNARLHPDDRERVFKESERFIRECVQKGEFEFRLRHRDGGYRWILARGTVVTDTDGQPARMYGSHLDITQRKRREGILKARQRLMDYAVEQPHVKDALILLLDEVEDLTGSKAGFFTFVDEDKEMLHIQAWSTRTTQTMCQMDPERLHYPIQEAGVWSDCIHQRQPIIHNDYPALPHRKGLPEGHAPIVRELLVPISRGERIVAVLGIANKESDYSTEDIHTVQELADLAWEAVEWLRSEKNLKEREQLYRTIMETTQDGYWIMDQAGNCLEVNDVYCRLSGYSRDELLSMKVTDLVEGKDPQIVAKRIEQVRQKGFERFESRHRRKDGRVYDVEISTSYLDIDEGRFIAFVRDITEDKQHERIQQTLHTATATRTGDAFFAELVCSLSKLLDVRWAYIARLEGDQVEMLAGCSRGDPMPPLRYNLRGTPCEKVVQEGTRHYAEQVQALFPEDDLLKDMGVECYIGTPLLNFDGEVIGLLVILNDQSLAETSYFRELLEFLAIRAGGELRRQASQQALVRSEERFRQIADSAGEWIWEVDTDGIYTYVNEGIEKILGYRPEDLVDRVHFRELIHPRDIEMLDKQLATIRENRESYRGLQVRHLHRDGHVVCLMCAGMPILDPAGNLLGYRGVDQDITTRVAAEEQLRKLSLATEQSPASIVITDRDGHIEYVNPKFTRVTGYSLDEVLGKTPRVLKSGEHEEAFYKNLWDTILSGSIWSGEMLNRKKNGQPFWETAQISPIFDEQGRITHLLGVKEDITAIKAAEKKRRELEQQLQMAQKMETIGTLAGGIAHDFNNILQSMFLYLGILLEEIDDSHHLREDFERVMHAAHRARDLVSQILLFSRQTDTERAPLEIHLLIKEALKMLRATTPSSIKIRVDIPRECPPVLCSASEIHQVVMNLCTNAIQSMEDHKGHLSVSLSATGADSVGQGWLELRIEDDGGGMSPDILERIYDPFFTTKEPGKGSGLGLSVVQGIVENLSGQIQVDSKAGRGTRFTLRLPVASEVAEGAKLEEGVAPAAPRTLTILVVDDEEAIVDSTRLVLERVGHIVLATTSSLDAKNMLEDPNQHIDLMISDLTMPGHTGSDLIAAARKTRAELPIILMSGIMEEDEIRQYQELGIQDYLAKPWTRNQLLMAITRAMEAHHTKGTQSNE